ncbi:oxidoreductase [Parafrankia soli]|uniref:NADH-quinone oxidoreductase subunit B family protein n=1 Tax=Parafrankia soli TaxID=2599596 RepID=UPI003B589CB8
MRGPFGRGWPLSAAAGSDVVVVAGGLGLAPLRPLIRAILRRRDDYGEVAVLVGSRTPADLLHRRELAGWQERADLQALVTIGACATAGGIQALRNFADVRGFLAAVYATPEYVSTLSTSTPISAHVRVDFELQGCPIDGRQLLEVISAFLAGRRPAISSSSVCTECKRRGTVCVMVAHGTPCLGPVTHAGCGAICPAYHRGCYGCFGPMESPNAPALTRQLKVLGMDDDDVDRVFQTFNAAAPAFRAASGGSEGGGNEGGGRSDHDD